MTTLDALLDPLRHSPLLPAVIERLNAEFESERQRRQKFYHDMTPEQKIEFIDGEVVQHSPAQNRHLDVTRFVTSLLATYVFVHKLGAVKSEKCLCVFPRNDYEPDVVFFGREKAALLADATLKFPVPDLAVEVLSDSTEDRDRGVKFEDFATNGVAEYWIVDADDSVIEQYVLRDGEYQQVLKSSSGILRSSAIAGFETDIEAVFNEQLNFDWIGRIRASRSAATQRLD